MYCIVDFKLTVKLPSDVHDILDVIDSALGLALKQLFRHLELMNFMICEFLLGVIIDCYSPINQPERPEDFLVVRTPFDGRIGAGSPVGSNAGSVPSGLTGNVVCHFF